MLTKVNNRLMDLIGKASIGAYRGAFLPTFTVAAARVGAAAYLSKIFASLTALLGILRYP